MGQYLPQFARVLDETGALILSNKETVKWTLNCLTTLTYGSELGWSWAAEMSCYVC